MKKAHKEDEENLRSTVYIVYCPKCGEPWKENMRHFPTGGFDKELERRASKLCAACQYKRDGPEMERQLRAKGEFIRRLRLRKEAEK